MKRRLLPRAVPGEQPEILILDEPRPTGPPQQAAVWEKLNNLKFRNTTLLLTTHYMEEAERLCDRVRHHGLRAYHNDRYAAET